MSLLDEIRDRHGEYVASIQRLDTDGPIRPDAVYYLHCIASDSGDDIATLLDILEGIALFHGQTPEQMYQEAYEHGMFAKGGACPPDVPAEIGSFACDLERDDGE